ncbi:MAG: TrmH family RNA methyltransferase [Myxococcota bacterium]|jgi:TrmH family RNA methyltransferase
MEPLSHLRVVLVRPLQSGNIGVAARALANHGISDFVLVDPPGFDPERARRMAPNAHDLINNARFVETVGEALEGVVVVIGTTGRLRRWDWPILTPTQLADQLDASPTAILFGPEDSGLSNADLARCHAIVSIPTAERRSLNLGQAVTVICAQLLAGVITGPLEEPEPLADSATQDAVIQLLLQSLRGSEYMRGQSEEKVFGTLYRLLARAQPNQREATALRGMLKKLNRRLRLTAED